MEAQTRFDLTTAIENWRQEMASQPGLTADNRRELETHLLDTVTEFQRRELTSEESFWLACRIESRYRPPDSASPSIFEPRDV